MSLNLEKHSRIVSKHSKAQICWARLSIEIKSTDRTFCQRPTAFPSCNSQKTLYLELSQLDCTVELFCLLLNWKVLLPLQSTKFMLGIIIAVICSNWVGDWILSEGVYETDLERDGSVVFLRPSPPLQLYTKSSQDIMAAPVWYVVTPRPYDYKGPATVNLYHLRKGFH